MGRSLPAPSGGPPAGAAPIRAGALAREIMEEVVERGNLLRALKRVRSNKGSPGVDGMTVAARSGYLREAWPRLKEELLGGT